MMHMEPNDNNSCSIRYHVMLVKRFVLSLCIYLFSNSVENSHEINMSTHGSVALVGAAVAQKEVVFCHWGGW